MDKQRLLAVARGEILADLVLKNAKIINVFTKSVDFGNLAIADGFIVGIGDYQGKEEIDYQGYYLSPGFIDGHVHIESSMLTPNNYALAVMPKGTTSVVADSHEIANVCGNKGIDFMIKASKASPLDVFMMIPSCVPSTPYETAGAKLLAKNIKKYIKQNSVLGLGEMMDYRGAINGDAEVLEKIKVFSGLTIDGHAPLVKGKDLNAYVLAGVQTDHECTEPDELIDKVKRGMYVHLREGSQTKNLLDLLPGLKPEYYDRVLFCSDDLHPSDIKAFGHMDNNIRIAIKAGIPPISAISMATINIANCYNIRNLGALAPGYKADIVAFKDLYNISVEDVFKNGKLVVKATRALFQASHVDAHEVMDTVNIDLKKINLEFILKQDIVNVIGLVKNNVTTKKFVKRVVLDQSEFKSSNNPNLLKLVVIERHHNTGNIGKGIVEGYGLKNAAIAMTIAHDSHNLICLGDNDLDMKEAINKIKEIGGGIVLVSKAKIIDFLPLEVAGLMSLKTSDFVEEKLKKLEFEVRSLGVSEDIEDPFLQLAFLSLAVIPELKLTDLGLFDVTEFKLIKLEAGEINEL